jgi:hypothetical protein
MKPQGNLDLRGMRQQAEHGLECAEALIEMLPGMVLAVRLGIPFQQRTIDGFAVAGRAGAMPGALPGRTQISHGITWQASTAVWTAAS